MVERHLTGKPPGPKSVTGEGEIMRKVNVLEFVSLDGVIQAPGGPEEDTSGGFAYGGGGISQFAPLFSTGLKKQKKKPVFFFFWGENLFILGRFLPPQKDNFSGGDTQTQNFAS